MKCTIHTTRELVPTDTQYGVRYGCPVGGCTVVLWGGSTSTPADFATRQARIAAHNWFDALWQSGIFSRKRAYKMLGKHLGLPSEKTHIGHFNYQQCCQAINFCKTLTEARGIGDTE